MNKAHIGLPRECFIKLINDKKESGKRSEIESGRGKLRQEHKTTTKSAEGEKLKIMKINFSGGA